MTVTIHMGSMLFGFFIGYVAIATVFLLMFFSKKWHLGFSEGWDAGKRYGEKAKKQLEGAGEQDG